MFACVCKVPIGCFAAARPSDGGYPEDVLVVCCCSMIAFSNGLSLQLGARMWWLHGIAR